MLSRMTEAPTAAEWGDPDFRLRTAAAYSGQLNVADAVGWLGDPAEASAHPLTSEVNRLRARIFSGTVHGRDYDDAVESLLKAETQITADRTAIEKAIQAARHPPADENKDSPPSAALDDISSGTKTSHGISGRAGIALLVVGLSVGAVGGLLGGNRDVESRADSPASVTPAPADLAVNSSVAVFEVPQSDLDLIGFSPGDEYLGETSHLLGMDIDSGVRVFGVQRSDNRTCLLAVGAGQQFAANCFATEFFLPFGVSVSWRFSDGEGAVSGEAFWLPDNVATVRPIS